MSLYSPLYQTPENFYSELPLADGQIRVLDIELNPDVWMNDAPLEARIRVVSLSDNPRFHALSYYWGQASESSYIHEIKLKLDNAPGTRRLVMKIADTAFGAIKDTLYHFGPTTIWIDAICINQNDTAEKNIQIPLMTEIYSGAVKVCVHLGAPTKETDIAMAWMTKASRRWYRGIGLLGPGAGGGIEKIWFTLMLRDWFTGKLVPGCLCILS
jgi:hypothetical protein